MTEPELKELQKFCTERHREVEKGFSDIAILLTRHDGRIGETEKDCESLCEKFKGMNNRLNQILGSVVIACIMLAINLIVKVW
jgi:hypothetical protein